MDFCDALGNHNRHEVLFGLVFMEKIYSTNCILSGVFLVNHNLLLPGKRQLNDKPDTLTVDTGMPKTLSMP